MRPLLPTDRSFAAFLFDMDGTLIDSIASATRAWSDWAGRHGLDVPGLLATMHGVRAVETITRWAPHLDVVAEHAALTQAEMDDVAGTLAIPGAAAFLASLPLGRWAIVTSAPRDLALLRLKAAGLTPPPVMITAEDVTHGKPSPDCYLAAAEALGVSAAECLVFEDAPAGIAAGEAAGAAVIVIGTTHAHPIETPHPVIDSYARITASADANGALILRTA